MSGSFMSKLRDLWLPTLIALVGILASLAVWGTLVANRRDLLLDSTAESAAQVREAVVLHLQQQLSALRGLSELWSEFGLLPAPEWKADVDGRIAQIRGLVSVAWVDLDEPRNRIAAGSPRSAHAIERDLAVSRRHARATHLVGPEQDASGAVAYGVFLPVRTPEDHAGALVAHFQVEPLLADMLQGRAQGYALAFSWEAEEIFSRGSPSTDRWQDWWRVEATIPLPLGGEWRLVLRPTPELAAARLTPVPHYLLGVGILLSFVLAALVYQFRVIVHQSRFLAASNRALEERGRELESRVAERTEALQDAIAELEAFNYSVAHDLRSPLGAILNFTSILEEDYRDRPLDGEGVAMLERIRQSTSRASALLQDLLQLSRAGRAALTLEPLDMTRLAREAFAQARAAEDEPDVEFVVDPLPEALGDRTLLGDVFVNLFSNALKYSRGREKRRIAVSGRSEDGECIYQVADNGIGFDMRFATKLFGLFERLHADEAIEGTGIGLAMVARIVKRHGGRVWAEGRPGRGAKFSFALPLGRLA
jgi:signal transduction histidine kinase